MAHVWVSLISGDDMLRKLFNRENLVALLLCLMLMAIFILTADKAPLWIYQGF